MKEATGFRVSVISHGLPDIPEVGDVHHFSRIELETEGTVITATLTPERIEEIRDAFAKVQVMRNASTARMQKLVDQGK